MFGKKCPKCNEKIRKKFEFCPFCGANLRKRYDERDYGMLGKEDGIEDQFNKMLGGFGGGMLNKMLSGTIKMLEKEMQKELKNIDKQEHNIPKSNFQLFVNGKKVNLGNLEEGTLPIKQIKRPNGIVPKHNKTYLGPSEEDIRKAAKLPRKEPKTNLKRLANKIIYEIEVPGIRSMNKILINKLEDSIEIKAFAKNKVYIKVLPINLPLIAYYLKKQKLFLEFQGK